jgi:endonuclease/exonuclease/phosphatase family metal-dependent hydrolase
MKLTLISWNIRHLRKEKIETHKKQVVKYFADGHVVFLYENKMGHDDNFEMYELLIDALGEAHGKADGIEIDALSVPVGTNEYVQIVYTAKRRTGPNSSYGQGRDVQIDVRRNTRWDDALWAAGWDRLAKSYNITVRSEIVQGRLKPGFGYRIPAVVDIEITKPDWLTAKIAVAAWHAPGPAKATAPSLFEAYANVLGDVHLFVGDFNYNPDTRFSPAKSVGRLKLQSTVGSTTIRESGQQTAHTSGPDLLYRNTASVCDRFVDLQLGKILIGNVEIREDDNALGATLYALSDHRPLVVTLKNL